MCSARAGPASRADPDSLGLLLSSVAVSCDSSVFDFWKPHDPGQIMLLLGVVSYALISVGAVSILVLLSHSWHSVGPVLKYLLVSYKPRGPGNGCLTVGLPADAGFSAADREASLELIKLDISRTFPSLCIFQQVSPDDLLRLCLSLLKPRAAKPRGFVVAVEKHGAFLCVCVGVGAE